MQQNAVSKQSGQVNVITLPLKKDRALRNVPMVTCTSPVQHSVLHNYILFQIYFSKMLWPVFAVTCMMYESAEEV